MNNKNESISIYLASIANYKVLSDSEMRELAVLARGGDESAKEEAVNCNLKLAAKIARDYVRPGFSWAEAISWANEGLILAIEKWDPEDSSKFSSYAARVIASKLRDGTRSERLQPITDYAWKMLTKIRKARAELFQSNEYDPSDEEIAETLGGKFTAAKVRELIEWSNNVESFDQPLGDDEDSNGYDDYYGSEDEYLFEESF